MAIDTRRPRPRPTPLTVNRPAPTSGPRRAARVRRTVLFAALFCLVPVAVSYAGVLVSNSNSSLGIRTVEWMRDNGARGLVNSVENFYYSLNAPAKGGKPLVSLPKLAGAVDAAGVRRQRGIPAYRPRPIQPPI